MRKTKTVVCARGKRDFKWSLQVSWTIILVAGLLGTPLKASANESSGVPSIAGVVAAVHDGDTFTIGKQKIRVFGIDAPELNQQCGADAVHARGPSPCVPCGHQSRDALSHLIAGKEVTCTKRGQSYDRMVAECRFGELNIGLWMLSHGEAVTYRQFLKKRDRRDYLGAEAAAKGERAGIWSQTFIPPADWRRHKMRLECER